MSAGLTNRRDRGRSMRIERRRLIPIVLERSRGSLEASYRSWTLRMTGLSTPIELRISTPVGYDLTIVRNEGAIVGSAFVLPARRRVIKPTDALLAEAVAQVRAYFAGRLRRFDLPLAFNGTEFQKDVWNAVAA